MVIFKIIIRGKIKVISTSKIKKIIAIKKKCNEKGIRADDLGSKPHSNGEFFSRSIKVFFVIIVAKTIIIQTIIIIIKENLIKMKITYTKC